MNWKKVTLTALLSLGLMTIPALAQDASTTSSGQATTTDHNDTNSKTKHAMKKAGEKTKDTAEAAQEKVSGKRLDINTASKEELAELPGMTADSAQKIIGGRPYKMKSDLVKKDIVSKDEYAKIKGHVIAKQSASSDTAKTKKKTKKTTTTTTGPSMK